MSTLFNDYIAPEDSTPDVGVATLQLQQRVNQVSHLSATDLSVESYFTAISNRFKVGSAGLYTDTVNNRLVSEFLRTLHAKGYGEVRMKTIPVAPGFKGPMLPFLTAVWDDIIPTLLTLPDQLKQLRSIYAAELNGTRQLDSLSGLPQIKAPMGIDLKVTLDSYFNKNLVKEALFGQIYPNLDTLVNSYHSLTSINNALMKVDYVTIAKFSNGFDALIADLKQYLREHNVEVGSNAFAQLAVHTSRLAHAVTLSAIVQETMKEVTNAFNQMAAKPL